MTESAPGSAARCACGHVRQHHRIGCCAFHDGCQWTGCGCPKFVEEPKPPQTEEQPAWVTEMAARIDKAAADMQAAREART